MIIGVLENLSFISPPITSLETQYSLLSTFLPLEGQVVFRVCYNWDFPLEAVHSDGLGRYWEESINLFWWIAKLLKGFILETSRPCLALRCLNVYPQGISVLMKWDISRNIWSTILDIMILFWRLIWYVGVLL